MSSSNTISARDVPRLDVLPTATVFRRWHRDIHNVLCAATDTQGFSVSEHLLGTDQGGPEGDPFEGGAAEVRAATAAFRTRKLKAWSSLLISLELHPLLKESLTTAYVATHDAHQAWLFVQACFDTPDTPSDIIALEVLWLGTTITGDIGNNLKSIHEFALRLDVINARLPPRDRHTEDETSERILEQIMTSSGNLSQAPRPSSSTAPSRGAAT